MKTTMLEDEDLLMAVLNSAPVIDGEPTDALVDPHGADPIAGFGGTGSADERAALRDVRDALQQIVRGRAGARTHLEPLLTRAALRPTVDDGGIGWTLDAPEEERLAVRTILAWARLADHLPGRLRPCANTECNLFLADHSRPGTARWCSMATCGNRMKARAHAERRRRDPGDRR